MIKPAFLTPERISRFVLSLLLMLGVLLPLLILFGLGGQILTALLVSAGLIALLSARSIGKPWTWLVPAILVALGLVQLVFPRLGFWGESVEALKGLVLFFNGLTVVMPLIGRPMAMLLAVCVSVASFLFSRKGVGFLPAAIMVVLVLFGLWSLGEGGLVWYTMPALIALLLLISQTAHEKIGVFNVLPMALAVVVLSLLLLPSGSISIQPLEQAAMDLKQTIKDYLFPPTGPRNVFTLESYGYYPMGSNQMGGEAEPSDAAVMMVKTDRKTLLRGVIRDDYTGRGFRNTLATRQRLYIDPRYLSFREKIFMEKFPPEALRNVSTLLNDKAVSIQMQGAGATTVFTPVFLRQMTSQDNLVPYYNATSELFITRDLQPGDRYTVYAPILEGGDDGLDALVGSAPKNDAYYAEMYSAYTRLPDHLEQKVYDDVANIIKDSHTPYDKAMAIMRYLQRYYRYTLSPATPPDNLDFITYFLYVGKEGYCTYYASAMTVLCRMAGLPTRYVEGFLAMPQSDGFAYVTGREAHAWTEVYFEGFGWVPFDPTPSQQGQNEAPPPPDNPEPEPDEEPTPSPSSENEQQSTPEPPPQDQLDNEEPPEESPPPEDPPPPDDDPFAWWLWLLALAGIGALIFQMRRRMPDRVALRAKTEKDQIFIYGNAVNVLLRLRGRMPHKGETPVRFARRMDNVHAFAVPIVPLWRMMSLSNYSRKQPGKEQAQNAKDLFARLYKPLSPLTKLRFLFRVAFDPKCYHNLDTVITHEEAQSKTRLPGPKEDKRQKGPLSKAKTTAGNPKRKPAASTAEGTAAKKPPVRNRRAAKRRKPSGRRK